MNALVQLDLFKPVPPPKPKPPKYPWLFIFPQFMPHAGGVAILQMLTHPAIGYCQCMRVRVQQVEGEQAVCVTDARSKFGRDAAKDGIQLTVDLKTLWPDVYSPLTEW